MKKPFTLQSALFTFLATFFYAATAFAQTITGVAVTPATICSGKEITVTFNETDFATGTTFTIQVSDANGVFTTPLATTTSKVSPINVTIPFNAPTGTGYKAKVFVASPANAGSESDAFAINTTPETPYSGVYPGFCVGDKDASLPVSTTPGTTFTWYAPDGTPLTGTPVINTTYSQVGREYVYSRTVNGCESGKARIMVNVYEVARTPSVTTPAPVCQNSAVSSAILINAVSTSQNFPQLTWYESESGGGSSTAPTPSTSVAGTKDYFVTADGALACASKKAKVTITIKEAPQKPVPVASSISYTLNSQAGVIATPSGANGATFRWYEDANSGSALPGAPTPNTSVAGKKSFFVSQIVDGCESERAEIVVTVSECTPPQAPAVTTPVSYTKDQVAVALKATASAGATLNWYGTSATGGSASATASIPSTNTIGTTTYYVSQTLEACESARAEIIVNVTACTPPAKPEVADINKKVGDPEFTLDADGENLKWYSSAIGGTGTSTKPKPSTATVGTTSYFVTQTVGGCESPRAEIKVTVTACTPPSPPVVSDVVNICLGSTQIVLTATGSNLKWYNSSGTLLASAPAPSTSTVSTTSYYVTQTVNGCESAKAKIDVVVGQISKPTVPTSTYSYCLGSTAKVLSATGEKLKWYVGSFSGAGSDDAPIPSTAKKGSINYFVTQTIGKCTSEPAEITVTISDVIPPAPTVASTTLSYCIGEKSVPALSATGKSLTWYLADGTLLAGAPTPAVDKAGTISYFVTQKLDVCESPKQEIKVITKALSAVPTLTSPTDYCVGSKTSALVSNGKQVKWYSENGTLLPAAPTPSTTNAKSLIYFVTQTENDKCESPIEQGEIKITINPTPSAVSTVPDIFCQQRLDENYVFLTKADNGNTLKWYTSLTSANPISTPLLNRKIAVDTTFYVSQVSKSCESVRVIQRVKIKRLPEKPIITTPLIEYCQFLTAKPLEATNEANAKLYWYGTNATGGDSSTTPTVPSTAEGGTTSYYVGQTLEECPSDRAKIDVKVNTTPKPTTKTYLEYCQGATAPILDATGTILKWYRTVDGEWQGFPFTPFTDKVQDYSFYVTQTGVDNKCESPKEEIKIHIKSLPSATITGTSTIDLGETANVNIKFTGEGPWSYILSDGSKGTTDQANIQVPVKPSTTTIYLLTEVANACGKGTPIGQALVNVKIPTINSGNPSIAEACAGKTFNVPFQQSGDFPAENTFKVQIATENEDSEFYTIPSVATSNSVTATFPDTTEGGRYYTRVISSGTNPAFLVKGSVSAITIMASPLPVATLSGAQTILVGESATLKVETTGKAPWTFTLSTGTKDTLITANTTPFTFKIAPATTVTYNITKVTNSCGTGTGAGSARVQVDPILGVEPQQPSNWVKVYPTLIQSSVTVEVSGNIKPKQARVEVIDLNGRSRAIQQIEQKTTEVNFANYPSGLYLLRIQNGNLSTVQRVMKP